MFKNHLITCWLFRKLFCSLLRLICAVCLHCFSHILSVLPMCERASIVCLPWCSLRCSACVSVCSLVGLCCVVLIAVIHRAFLHASLELPNDLPQPECSVSTYYYSFFWNKKFESILRAYSSVKYWRDNDKMVLQK